MCSSSFSYRVLTNNPDIYGHAQHVELIGGGALDVLTAARDKIHTGWELLSNPLYGNFKPNQQPYRTLVLRFSDKGSKTDVDSLALIESALNIYANAPVLRYPGDLPEETDGDFRYLDFKLLEETFRTCGLLHSEFARSVGRCKPTAE